MLEKLMRRNERGFTLAELLVVVAIIAILVAISIPIFTSKLEKSREATDVANMRAAKAAATVAVLDESQTTGTLYYDAEAGVLKTTKAGVTNGYGKGTAKDAGTKYQGYNPATAYTDQIIQVDITSASEDADAAVALTWIAK